MDTANGRVDRFWYGLFGVASGTRRDVVVEHRAALAGYRGIFCVLSAPAVRGRGIAALVAAQATSNAIEQHGIARWRALAVNVPSRRLARRLGFQDDCVQLALRPA